MTSREKFHAFISYSHRADRLRGSQLPAPLQTMQQHAPSPDATALDPSVLLEVTCDSSEDYDTGGKLDAYKSGMLLRARAQLRVRPQIASAHLVPAPALAA